MTSDDLRAWQTEMDYTYDTAASELGVARSTYAAWIHGSTRIPGPVGLACAALVAGLVPYEGKK